VKDKHEFERELLPLLSSCIRNICLSTETLSITSSIRGTDKRTKQGAAILKDFACKSTSQTSMAVCTCMTRAIDVHQEQSMFIRCELEQGSRSNLAQADVGVGACASGTSRELCDGLQRRSTEHACTTTGRPSPRSPNRAPTSLRPRWQISIFASSW